MINMRKLLLESVSGISPSDIYNFYFLWHQFVNNSSIFKGEYSSFILEQYTKEFKNKYLQLFKALLSEQLQKYVSRGRVDKDFDVKRIGANESAETLWRQMQKTFRTDMKRRNDVWNLVGEYLTSLERAMSAKDIFTYVDRLNACVHNTDTLVLGKFGGGNSLMQAYDTAHNHNPQHWKQYVNKDIRQLLDQGSMNESNTVKVSKADRENILFMTGVKTGVKDKAAGIDRDLAGYAEDFVRGYKIVPRDS